MGLPCSLRQAFASVLMGVALVGILSVGIGVVSSSDVYAAPGDTTVQDAPGDSPADPDNPDAGAKDENTCAIEKMGWILCPLIETAGKVGDRSFQFLSKTFLEIEPELVASKGSLDGGKSGTYTAWELARNFANILFIAAFLIIILSQVTGRGINNYGIKKTLPRIIIAAVAVNVSYYLCQAMVDLSNILGYEIQNFLVDIATQVSDKAVMPAQTSIDNQTSNGNLSLIATAAVSLTAVWFLLPILMLGIGTVVITAIVIVIILLLRKAFIILLVVVSPIAFVLYLLPNTEKYFQKWLSMFWKLLMIFPVVGLLFGAGQLASSIILVAGTNNNSDLYSDGGGKCIQLSSSTATNGDGGRVGDCSPGATPFMLGLIAAGIAVAPLLAVVSVLKGALSAAGAIGGKISGAVESYTGKGVGKAGEKFKKTSVGRGMEARKAIKQNYQDQRFAERMGGGHGPRGAYTRISARGITGNIGRANIAPGSWNAQNSKLAANFASSGAKLQDQEMNERQAQYSAMLRENRGEDDGHGNIDEADKMAFQLEQAIRNGDEAGAKAAVNIMATMGEHGMGKLRDSIGNTDTIDNKAMRELKAHITNNQSGIKSSDADIYSWAGSNPTGEGSRLSDADHSVEAYKKLTDAQLATQTLASQRKAISSGALNLDSAKRIFDNTSVRGTAKGKQLQNIQDISQGNAPTHP